jgi:hypothetical protein
MPFLGRRELRLAKSIRGLILKDFLRACKQQAAGTSAAIGAAALDALVISSMSPALRRELVTLVEQQPVVAEPPTADEIASAYVLLFQYCGASGSTPCTQIGASTWLLRWPASQCACLPACQPTSQPALPVLLVTVGIQLGLPCHQ